MHLVGGQWHSYYDDATWSDRCPSPAPRPAWSRSQRPQLVEQVAQRAALLGCDPPAQALSPLGLGRPR